MSGSSHFDTRGRREDRVTHQVVEPVVLTHGASRDTLSIGSNPVMRTVLETQALASVSPLSATTGSET